MAGAGDVNRLMVAAMLLLAAFVLRPTVLQAGPLPEIRAHDCPALAAGLDARCLTARLALNDEQPGDARTIAAELIVLPSSASATSRQAVFILEGGPGLRAIDAVAEFARDWRELRQTHDLVVMNTRGLDGNGLWCRPKDASEKRIAYTAEIFPRAMLARCRTELERVTDLTRYTSTIMARDIDALRATLGYDRIGLIAYSYGTRLAQEYIRRFPDRTSAAVLLGAVEMDTAYPQGLAQDTQAVFDAVERACAADRACAQAYPTLGRDMQMVAQRLSGGIRATVSYDGASHDVTLARGIVTTWLRSRLYAMETVATVPKLLHQLASGDTAGIAQAIVDSQRSGFDGTAYGLWLSLTCSEDVGHIDLPTARARSQGTLMGDDRLVEQAEACAAWPRGAIPSDFRQPVATDVPVLQVSGGFDPATRPEHARRIDRRFANGEILLIPNESHIFRRDWDRCIGALATDFMRRAGWHMNRPDMSCAAQIQAPPFTLPDPAT